MLPQGKIRSPKNPLSRLFRTLADPIRGGPCPLELPCCSLTAVFTLFFDSLFLFSFFSLLFLLRIFRRNLRRGRNGVFLRSTAAKAAATDRPSFRSAARRRRFSRRIDSGSGKVRISRFWDIRILVGKIRQKQMERHHNNEAIYPKNVFAI